MFNITASRKSFFHYLIFFSILFHSCDSFNPSVKPNAPLVEMDGLLTDNDLRLIDELQIDSTTKFSDLLFDDLTNMSDFLQEYDSTFYNRNKRTSKTASSFNDQKNLFLTKILKTALFLTDREKHIYKDVEPHQYGIAYSLGSKQYENPQPPTSGTCNEKKLIHGLDCSGFIYQIVTQAGYYITNSPDFCNVNYLRNVNNWNNALERSSVNNNIVTDNLMQMKLIERGNIDDIQTGDIIVFGNVHIGIVMEGKKLVHSSGYPDPDTKRNRDCNDNFKKGPRVNVITSPFLKDFNDGVFSILRLVPKCVETSKINIITYYKKTGTQYFFHYSYTGGKPPYRDEVRIDGKLNNSSGDIQCNEAQKFESFIKFKPINIKVWDENDNTEETTFIAY